MATQRLAAKALITMDVTGTLLDVAPSVGYFYKRVLIRAGWDVGNDEDVLNQRFQAAFRKWDALAPSFTVAGASSSFPWWRQVIMDTLQVHPATLPDADRTRLENCCRSIYDLFATREPWHLFPDVIPFLQLMKQQGRSLVAISNFDERLPNLLRDVGILSYFDLILTSFDSKHPKPSVVMFEAALRGCAAPVSAKAALHIGDSYSRDVVPARSLGMSAVLLQRRNGETVHEDGAIGALSLSSLADLASFLQ